jgi:hypothetical protein
MLRFVESPIGAPQISFSSIVIFIKKKKK